MNNIEFIHTNLPHAEGNKIVSKAAKATTFSSLLFNSVPINILVVNQEIRIVDTNHNAIIEFKTEREQIIGLFCGELFGCVNSFKEKGCGKNDECSACVLRNSVIYTFQTNEIVRKKEVELKIKTNDGFSKKYLRISTTLIQQNNEPMVLLTADDITEQKLSEKVLKKSEIKYKELADSLPQAVFETDLQGNLIFVNRHAFDMFGFMQGDFDKGINVFQTLMPEDSERAKLDFERVVCGEGRESNEYTALRKDDSTFPIIIYASRIVYNNKTIGIRGILVDITERKEADRALRESEEKFRTIFENASDAIYVTGLDGQFLEVNQVACDQLGYSRSELLQMGAEDIDSFDDAAQVEARINQILRDGHIIFETAQVRKDGSIMPADVSSRIIDYMGKKALLGITRDITKHKQAEETMLNAKLTAEAVNRAKTEFVANMSHELRTPLNSIIGFSDILCSENQGSLNEYQKKYTSNVLANGKHLLNIINEILDFSKVESGKMELNIEEIILTKVIEEIETSIIPLSSNKNIELTFNMDVRKPIIKADMMKFKQILYNLVSNAIKFTDQGGSVTIGGQISEDLVHISVKDSGIGISPKDQAKLFDPFFQVDSSTTREYGGTGLGLTLVKKFVEMHHGNIWIESEIGKGSTFTFIIPTDPENTSF
ncbi:PAS domain-containing hybrid sensor histidine kinase/response regulator [Methanococcoides sp.]|uniref:PAS domain-containing hybrid sensor histidine kinase/response regulator n=1 Tax=Methanococcoides sp. TaxID=1966350 RepID=UPI00272E2184|nr:PAS domain-containing hybrid sensor histidine kinase/response regulator [Methanococcoides sp.]